MWWIKSAPLVKIAKPWVTDGIGNRVNWSSKIWRGTNAPPAPWVPTALDYKVGTPCTFLRHKINFFWPSIRMYCTYQSRLLILDEKHKRTCVWEVWNRIKKSINITQSSIIIKKNQVNIRCSSKNTNSFCYKPALSRHVVTVTSFVGPKLGSWARKSQSVGNSEKLESQF